MVEITNETEYRKALEIIEPFLLKGFDNLTEEEELELHRMSLLIEAYEDIHYMVSFKVIENGN